MDIYTYYDSSDSAPERQGEFIKLWERSWRLRGWTPKILTARKARSCPFFSKELSSQCYPWLAFERVGGGWFSSFTNINFNFEVPEYASVHSVSFPVVFYDGVVRASRLGALSIVESLTGKIETLETYVVPISYSTYPHFNWSDSKIVRFESVEDILNCGRSIC